MKLVYNNSIAKVTYNTLTYSRKSREILDILETFFLNLTYMLVKHFFHRNSFLLVFFLTFRVQQIIKTEISILDKFRDLFYQFDLNVSKYSNYLCSGKCLKLRSVEVVRFRRWPRRHWLHSCKCRRETGVHSLIVFNQYQKFLNKKKILGGNSQNFLWQFLKIFVTLRWICEAIVNKKLGFFNIYCTLD